MEARELKGLEIAARMRIVRNGSVWVVPSQTGKGRYGVDPHKPSCTCEDFQLYGPAPCKHIYAVRCVLDRRGKRAMEAEIEQNQLQFRKTYRQDWPNYNLSQQNERRHFQEFLADLCRTVVEPPRKPGRGRKPIPFSDAAFAAVFKVYSGNSARRFTGELEEARERGYVGCAPHFNIVLKYLESDALTPVLHLFIEQSCIPLRPLESQFAVDSTGFATMKYESWYDRKYGITRQEAKWVKVHAMVGTVTNCVTAATILDQDAADSPQFPGLVKATARGFRIAEVSGDKAYAGNPNFEAVDAVGGMFYPAFRKNTTGAAGGLFEQAFHLFSLNRDEYLKHYHRRSNVESLFSALKRKFGEMVLSKGETAQKNEVLAKIVAFNLTCVIEAMYTLGIAPTFGEADTPPSVIKFPARA